MATETTVQRLQFEIWVAGIPEPQGSARAFFNKKLARPIITSDNKDLRHWRAAVCQQAQASWREGPALAEPVGVELRFVFPRPVSHLNRLGQVLRSKPKEHATRPDLDKLCRGVIDALADAGVLRNDAQVARLIASKEYGERPGAQIQVWTSEALPF